MPALLHQYGLGLVFLLVALEAMGAPLPGETVMVAAALYAAHSRQWSPLWLVTIAAAGAISGGIGGYLIGCAAGTRLLRRYGPLLGLTRDRRLLGRYLMYRHGALLVFFGRFIALLRAVTSILAGAAAMDWRRFMVANVLGGVVWPALYVFAAYLLGNAVLHRAGIASVGIAVVAALAFGSAALFVRHHERRLTQAALAAFNAGLIADDV